LGRPRESEPVRLAMSFKVSRYGSGLYMRIPTALAEAMAIEAGDILSLTVHKIVKASRGGKKGAV